MKYLTDYLPIKNPLEYEPEDKNFFYDNIAKHLIEDVVKLSNEGIPIDLNKIKELDVLLNNTIQENEDKLANNQIIQYYIKHKNNRIIKDKIQKAEKNIKLEDFLVPFNFERNTHINALVDVIVQELIEQNILTKNYIRLENTNWTIKKLKDIHYKTNNQLILKLIEKDYDNIIFDGYKQKAMYLLAEIKLNKELKKIEDKKTNIENTEQFNKFNPSSAKQIQELFQYLQISSRLKTDAGSDSFNKAALQELLDIINNKINQLEEKENDS